MARKCAAPKSQPVKAHTRSKPRGLKKAAAKRAAKLQFVVRDQRTGNVVSRHRTLTAAARERQRRDLISYRAGKGRHYETGRA